MLKGIHYRSAKQTQSHTTYMHRHLLVTVCPAHGTSVLDQLLLAAVSAALLLHCWTPAVHQRIDACAVNHMPCCIAAIGSLQEVNLY